MQLDWRNFYDAFLPFLPATLASDVTLIGTAIIALCAVAARFWPRPVDGSNWLPLYLLVNRLAMNSRHAENAGDQKNGYGEEP
ncbi:hypothetical protein [Asaia krungthepensis]|uniref:Uncharacterized protein n=1 Tax=Asaia krungthepensis NRIC 0535 TaxID=1307925 RepID=A0ABQ0Q1G0_9PROT|nr:hypothetical protein [Asaia krungthepensis]GBQ86793.1 hypothetical protein AA0535_1110 [Asaia krungthepensis NRIC 0535]